MASNRSLSGSGWVDSQYSLVLAGASTRAPCSCWDYRPRNWAAHLLKKPFLEHACFLSCLHVLPLCSVILSLAPSSSHASPAGGTAPPWTGIFASSFSWATEASFLQAWGFPENLSFNVPMEVHSERKSREMLWGVRYRCLDKGRCGGHHVGAGTWNVPDILDSAILVDFPFHLNKRLSALLINDF